MMAAVKSECQGIESVSVSVNNDIYDFDIGRMYLICNPRSDRAFSIARDFLSSGHSILCVSRYHPDLVRDMCSSREFRSVWLSDRRRDDSISANQLPRLKMRISSFLKSREGRVIVLEGIEYLSLSNDFPKLLRFVEELNDIVMELRAILLIPVDPRSFDRRSLARLRRFAEVVH